MLKSHFYHPKIPKKPWIRKGSAQIKDKAQGTISTPKQEFGSLHKRNYPLISLDERTGFHLKNLLTGIWELHLTQVKHFHMKRMDLNTCIFFIWKIASYQYFMGILAIFNAETQMQFICIYIFINRFMIFQKVLRITA